MKVLLAALFSVCLYVLVAALDGGADNFQGLVSLDGRLGAHGLDVTDTTKTEVIYHTSSKHTDHAADIKFGDALYDKITEIQDAIRANPAERSREILLKCKVPGCIFRLAAEVYITEPFKIRGALNQGQRPQILLSSPFHVGSASQSSSSGYAQNFNGLVDGTVDLGDGTMLNNNGFGDPQVIDNMLQLTNSIGDQVVAFHIPALAGSSSGWKASFDYSFESTQNTPADGFAFSYGNLPTGLPMRAEEGWGSGVDHISFEFDTWSNGPDDQGPAVAVNNVNVDANPGSIYDDLFMIQGTIEIVFRADGVIDFTSTGAETNANFVNLSTGFIGDDSYTWAFGARTGGSFETLKIDNLRIDALPEVFAMESVNIIGSGKQSQSHVVVQGGITARCDIIFDKVDFKNHHVGFASGGAIDITDNSGNHCKLIILTSRFINNSAKNGGAIHNADPAIKLTVLNSHFIGNAAIEEGGALWTAGSTENCDFARATADAFSAFNVKVLGSHFKDNTANKKGDTFVGRGGAIFAQGASLLVRDSRTHGGNTAKFGNLVYLENSCFSLTRFGCYEGPFNRLLNSDGYEGYGEYYSAYPTCSASSYDTYALREDIYARDGSEVLIQGVDLPGGVTCEERSTASTVTRHGCGSHIYAYHCLYGDDDHYVEAEDYDRDGFDCRYDCNDVWSTVNPAAGEQCNYTIAIQNLREMTTNLFVEGDALDSNCNGLANEWIDVDGDHVPDWYDECPHDYWKISPGKCGCGYEDTEGCVQTGGLGECTTVEDNGIWYYMCEGNWWYWGDNDWTYGGEY